MAFVAASASAGSAVGARRRPTLVAHRRSAAAVAVGAYRSTQFTMGEFTRFVDGVERRRVVVAGIDVTAVFGMGVDVFYDNLLAGERGIKPIEACDCDGLATRLAGDIARALSEYVCLCRWVIWSDGVAVISSWRSCKHGWRYSGVEHDVPTRGAPAKVAVSTKVLSSLTWSVQGCSCTM